ncbi:MAG: hypothetical protein ACI3V5_05095 [Faecousia sp.]
MLELLLVIAFGWLFIKAVGLAFKVAWGVTKIVAMLLFVLACPLLIAGLLFAGGVVLLVPVAMIGVAFGLLKKCV